MKIARAAAKDIPGLNRLLRQVLLVHHQGRPDLFRADSKKYTDEELTALLADDSRPVFAAWNEQGEMLGYAFCIFQETRGSNVLQDMKTLYIDDICVEETARGQHVGTALYRHVLAFAQASGCYNVTLNVWSCNPAAMKFYEAMGMKPQKVGMEVVLGENAAGLY